MEGKPVPVTKLEWRVDDVLAFVDDSGLYVASGPVKDDKLFVQYETLYLPEAVMQK